MPPNAAQNPARAKASSFVLSTFTPVAIAACLLPPVAKIWLPIRFRSSSTQKTIASATHHKNVAGITPMAAEVNAANPAVGVKGWDDGPCTKYVAAVQKKDVP